MKENKRIKTVYWSDTDQGIVDEVRELLIKIDREKKGRKYVEKELNRGHRSKYSDSSIIRFIIREGGKTILKDLSAELEKLQKAKRLKKAKEKARVSDPLEKIVKDLSEDRAKLMWHQL